MAKGGKLRRWVLRHNPLLMSSACSCHLSNQVISPISLEALEPLIVYVDDVPQPPNGHVVEREKPRDLVTSHVLVQGCRPMGRDHVLVQGCRPIGRDHVTVQKCPRGHVAVYVGEERERFLVPIAYLSHPLLEGLLEMSACEFGYAHRAGLRIPCTPSLFHRTLTLVHTDFTHPQAKKSPSISLGHC